MKLVTTQGDDASIEYGLDKPVITLGRGSDADIVIRDPQASRHHAEIRVIGDHFTITDLGSTNGTFVNGVQIQGTHTLQPGDEIRIGHAILRLEEGRVAAPPLPLARSSTKSRPAPEVAPPRGNFRWQ